MEKKLFGSDWFGRLPSLFTYEIELRVLHVACPYDVALANSSCNEAYNISNRVIFTEAIGEYSLLALGNSRTRPYPAREEQDVFVLD